MLFLGSTDSFNIPAKVYYSVARQLTSSFLLLIKNPQKKQPEKRKNRKSHHFVIDWIGKVVLQN